jgi:hypothetical protein
LQLYRQMQLYTCLSWSNLNVESFVLVAHLQDFRPRKTAHFESIAIDVKSRRIDSNVDVKEFAILYETQKLSIDYTRFIEDGQVSWSIK